jgi:hypothetical protein
MRLLLMLPNKETEKLVSCRFLRQVLRQTWFLWSGVGLLKDLRRLLTRPLLVFVVEVCAPCADKSASPEEVIFNRNKAAAERRRAAHKALHKE